MDAYKIIYGLFRNKGETLEYLKANPEKIDETTKLDETPLHYCVIENRADLVMELISLGADVNHVEFAGNSPLMHAIQLGYGDIVEMLIIGGADYDIQNNSGETALSIATKKKNKRLFEFLLNRRKHDIQYYFSSVDAMEILESSDEELHKLLIVNGLKNPFDA